MGPLAGKPPFATDEPDSFYESSPAPQPRIRKPAPPNPNARTSAYNVYDNYLGPGDANTNRDASRQSGVGALGMGLLNMSDSDDDSDDEDSHKKPHVPSKNAALAAATGAASRSPPPRSSSKHVLNPNSQPVEPPTIAAPRPGYVAPIAALNLARPEPATIRAPPPRQIEIPRLQNPFEPPIAQVYDNTHGSSIPSSPSRSVPPSTPHPLQPPITPITPVFARPAKPGGVAFADPIPRSRPVMRGGTEDALLPRRGEKGDDFWRRFSMVAKIENRKPAGSKESWWLKKTQNGTSRLSRWVWVLAIVLILCIVGASVIGWKVSTSRPAHQAPTAFGGSANERPDSITTSAPVATGSTGSPSSIKHVSPTYTVARRGTSEAAATARPLGHKRAIERRKIFEAVTR